MNSLAYLNYFNGTLSLMYECMYVCVRMLSCSQNMADGADIQAELLAMTGQRTVPSVFVNGEHIGGNDDTQAAIKSGTLQAKLGM